MNPSTAPSFRDLGLRLLRSINSRTGAIAGVTAPAAYVLSAAMTTFVIGRPSAEQVFGAFAALVILCAAGAVMGGAAGTAVYWLVSSTPLAGPADRRTIRRCLLTVATIATLFGAEFVHRAESRSRPRVFHSDGTLLREDGDTAMAPRMPATVILDPFSRRRLTTLKWRDRDLRIALEGQTLIINQSSGLVDQISLEGLDYVSQVVAATAELDGKREWLALLVRLRSTGRRELLLIYDPAGVRVYQELLARTSSGPKPVLWAAGPASGPQEFVVSVGEPVRFSAQ